MKMMRMKMGMMTAMVAVLLIMIRMMAVKSCC